MLLRGSKEPVRIFLRSIEGYVTGLSVSPDGNQAVRRYSGNVEGQEAGRFEVQIYRFSEGLQRCVAYAPEGMEILGAPQWPQGGIYFVASINDSDGATRGEEPVSYALYRTSESSDTPEPVRDLGEDFVAPSISGSPDGNHLAMVGRRNLGSPTCTY
jgi:hypothetical protein